MKDEEILNIIDNALENKQKLKEMSEYLYKKINEEHNLQKATEDFNDILSQIIM